MSDEDHYTASLSLGGGSKSKGGPRPGLGPVKTSGAVNTPEAYVIMAMIQHTSFGPGSLPQQHVDGTAKGFAHIISNMLLPNDHKTREFPAEFLKLLKKYGANL